MYRGNGSIGYTVNKSDLCTSIYVKLAVIVMPDIAVSMVIMILIKNGILNEM